MKLYEKYAKPIFQLANVDVSVIITQRSNQIFDLVLQQHLDHFDGIACCGGDGTFSELFNGLIYRDILREHSNDLSKLDINNIPKPSKPLGIIPAGSTDSTAYCFHGTTDIKTCIIHIVLGQTTAVDLASVSSDKGIIKFYSSALSYGFLGDVLYESDKHRWMGPRRYEYSGFKKILVNRGYDAELLILQEPERNESDVIANCDVREEMKCIENCAICGLPDSDEKPSEEKFKRISGKFYMVFGVNISCACDRSPSGVSPYCHVGDGFVDVLVVRYGGFFRNIKVLMTLAKADGDIEKLPNVELYRTRKFHFKALNSSSDRSLNESSGPIPISPNKTSGLWNCDGEILNESDLTVR